MTTNKLFNFLRNKKSIAVNLKKYITQPRGILNSIKDLSIHTFTTVTKRINNKLTFLICPVICAPCSSRYPQKLLFLEVENIICASQDRNKQTKPK